MKKFYSRLQFCNSKKSAKIALLLFLSLAFQTGVFAQASDLIISEYVEGGSYNKYIEVYNGTGGAVNLADYMLVLYDKGQSTSKATYVLSTAQATLGEGKTLVISNPEAKIYGGTTYTYEKAGVCDFNGDDPVYLEKSGVEIDAVGVKGGTSKFGKDKTFIRKKTVKSPSVNFDISNWEVKSKDDVGNLGMHTMDGVASFPTVQLSVSSENATEADATQITITAAVMDNLSSDQTVDIKISGTVTTDDYTLAASTLTIASGSKSASTTLTIVDDNEEEGNENLIITLENPSAGMALGSAIAKTIKITDNDLQVGGEVKLIISQYYEGSGTNKWIEISNIGDNSVDFSSSTFKLGYWGASGSDGNINITGDVGKLITLKGELVAGKTMLVGNSGNQTEVTYIEKSSVVNLSSDLAFNGNDGVALLDGNDQIIDMGPNGVSGANTSYVRKASVTEGKANFVLAEWDKVTNADVISATETELARLNYHSTTVAPSLPKVNMTVSTTTASEADKTQVTITATASEELAASETVQVNLTGTGIEASDYTLSASEITIAAGAISGFVTLTVVDDSDAEGTETMNIALGTASSGIVLGETKSASLVITDNEAAPTPRVSIQLSATTASERAATQITVTAQATGTVTDDQTINVAVSGTDVTSSDYTLSATSITILNGQSSASVTLTIVDDSEDENTETFVVTLSNPSAGLELVAPKAANLTVSDNDGGILGNYEYLPTTVDGSGNVVVALTPKEYVATVSTSQHMASVGYVDGYYTTAVGLSGTALRQEIKSIINENAKSFDYGTVWNMCEEGDQNPKNSNEVWQIYVERGIAKSSHVSGSTGWNREHVWAKSHGGFGTSKGRGTDGHHLRASDAKENSNRGSRDFANASPGYTPPKSARGDVARMILYMATRYEMTVDDLVKSSESQARHGKLSDLLEWHEEDPVDPYEIRRNNVIFGYQKNRNPFVDHPELVQHIFGQEKESGWSGGSEPIPLKITIKGSFADFGMVKFGNQSSVQSVTVAGTELTANISITAPMHFVISTDNTSFSKQVELTQTAGTVNATTLYVKFAPEAALNTVVEGKINIVSGDNTRTISVKGREADPALTPVEIFADNFETGTFSNWTVISEQGPKGWEERSYGGNSYAQMTIRDEDLPEDQPTVSWFISPALNLDQYKNEILTFVTKNAYYKGTTLSVHISTDFDGSSVSTATWTPITATIDEKENVSYGSVFVESGEVDLSAINGSKVHLAFRYVGSTNGINTTYQVDDVLVKGISTTTTTEPDAVDASKLDKSKTFDVVSWNVEWFGAPSKSKSASSFDEQLQAVSSRIIEMDADIYALQEVVGDDLNGDFLTKLVDELNKTKAGQYAGVVGPRYSYDNLTPTADFPAQRVCYVYNTATVSKLSSSSMFSNVFPDNTVTDIPNYTGPVAKFWASGRLPFFMDATVTIEGVSRNIKLVNIHAKCCKEGADRRRADAAYLLNELNTTYEKDNIIVLGDYNDYQKTSMDGGLSPYAGFWANNNKNFKHFVGSAIDHIAISNELYDEAELLKNNTSTTEVNISDHDPIMLRLKLYDSTKKEQTITFSGSDDIEMSAEPVALQATSTSGLPVQYEVTAGGATIKDGALILSTLGSITIKATQPGNTHFEAATAVSRTFTVVKGSQTISFADTKVISVGEKIVLEATTNSKLAVTLEITEGEGTLDGNTFTATKIGAVTITATQAGNDLYKAATATKTITVDKKSQTITFAKITDPVRVGEPFELQATASSGLTVKYELIEGQGDINGNVFTSARIGSVTIKATQAGDANYKAAQSVTRSIEVEMSTSVLDAEKMQVKVFPNPSADYIDVESNQTTPATVYIYNAQQQLVKQAVSNGKTRISLLGLENGTYYLVLKTKTTSVTKAIVVVR